MVSVVVFLQRLGVVGLRSVLSGVLVAFSSRRGALFLAALCPVRGCVVSPAVGPGGAARWVLLVPVVVGPPSPWVGLR